MLDVEVGRGERAIRGPAKKRRSKIVGASRGVAPPIVHIHANGDADLPQVVNAMDGINGSLSPHDCGQQQGSQNRDDRDDDQQLNECECLPCAPRFHNRF